MYVDILELGMRSGSFVGGAVVFWSV